MIKVKGRNIYIGTSSERVSIGFDKFLAGDEFIETNTEDRYISDGSQWVVAGDTSPGGSNKQIQFNDGGGFGGNSNFTFDKSSNILTLSGDMEISLDSSSSDDTSALSVSYEWSPTTTTGSVFPKTMSLQPTYDSSHSPSGGYLSSLRAFVEIAGSGNLNIRNIDLRSRNNGSGTVINAQDIRIRTPVNDGGGSITTYTGLYIEDPGGVATTNYAIRTFGGHIQFGGNNGAVLFPNLTTTQRNALAASNGMVIYNVTNNRMEAYENGSWVDL